MKKYFERRIIFDREFSIWERRAGGNWQPLIRRNEFREQYGPYAS